MSVEEMVAWIESGIAISDKGGFVVPVADLAALIADWRKRGEALAALADSEKVEPCWRPMCSHALAR